MFGKEWGNFGSKERTEVRGCVAGISPDPKKQIGLSAMQLDNLGYHPRALFRVSLNENTEKHNVDVWNACGMSALNDDEIWVSKGLADIIEIKLGDVITITRTSCELSRNNR